MLLKNKSLTVKIWSSFILFSVTILSFLWLFQVIFLDTYYESSKKTTVTDVAHTLQSSYGSEGFADILDDLAFERGVCIELIQNNRLVYMSNHYEQGCFDNKRKTSFSLWSGV